MPQSDVGELNSRSPSLLTPTPPFPQETISISDDEDSVVEVKAKPFEGKVHFRDNDIPESAQPVSSERHAQSGGKSRCNFWGRIAKCSNTTARNFVCETGSQGSTRKGRVEKFCG